MCIKQVEISAVMSSKNIEKPSEGASRLSQGARGGRDNKGGEMSNGGQTGENTEEHKTEHHLCTFYRSISQPILSMRAEMCVLWRFIERFMLLLNRAAAGLLGALDEI